jgi:dCTP deaminase
MSVVDLCKRATSDWDVFCKSVRSCDSLIYFEEVIPDISDPPGSVDLAVGTRWFDPVQEAFYAVEETGLQVKPHSAVVVEVQQRIAVPHNVMGIVTGKGKYIFQSALISPGKIDPGFNGRLRIGFYNASNKIIHLKRGDSFCSCFFFNTESEAKHPRRLEMEPTPKAFPLPRYIVVKRFWADNWKVIFPLIVSVIAMLISLFK